MPRIERAIGALVTFSITISIYVLRINPYLLMPAIFNCVGVYLLANRCHHKQLWRQQYLKRRHNIPYNSHLLYKHKFWYLFSLIIGLLSIYKSYHFGVILEDYFNA